MTTPEVNTRQPGGMGRIVSGTFRLYATHLPALLAFFLAGWIANHLLIRFGGFVANIDPLLGQLVLPLAVLARVASYVAMFLVLRPGRSFAAAMSSSILPFLVVFATWGMIKDDWVAFSLAQLEQRRFDGTDPELFVTITPISIAVVVIAFVLRFLIKRYSTRLPRWFSFVAAYLEAVWIFLAIDIIGQAAGWITAWLNSRRIVAWGSEMVEAAREAVAPLAWITDAIGWLVAQAAVVVGLPLAWLTLAGIVYAVTTPLASPTRLASAASRRLARLPRAVRARLAEVGADLAGRWLPISQSARLIWRSGVVTMALFVVAYAVLDTSSEWLQFGLQRLLGPHPLAWWFAADTPMTLLVGLIVEPLRISLIAAAWAYCLTLSDAGRDELQREDESVGIRRGVPQA